MILFSLWLMASHPTEAQDCVVTLISMVAEYETVTGIREQLKTLIERQQADPNARPGTLVARDVLMKQLIRKLRARGVSSNGIEELRKGTQAEAETTFRLAQSDLEKKTEEQNKYVAALGFHAVAGENTRGVFVKDGEALVVSLDRLTIINLQNGSQDEFPIPDGDATGVFVTDDGKVLVSKDKAGILKLDRVARKFSLFKQTTGYPKAVRVYGNAFFTAEGKTGVGEREIISGIPAPESAAKFSPVHSYARDIYVTRDKIYVADGNKGLTIIDRTGREDVDTIDVPAPGFADGVFVDEENNVAYLAYGGGGLKLINLKTRDIRDFSLPSPNATGIFIHGDLAYITTGSGLLVIQKPAW